MSALTKIDNDWKNVTAPYVKVAGNWKIAKSAWAKVDEKWKSWFLQGGIQDLNFTTNTGTAANNSVNFIALQPDGKIVVVGGFTTWNGAAAQRVVRLNSDGTVDTSFSTNIGTATNGAIEDIAMQSDGKLILCGFFTTWNGAAVERIVRLNSDGTRDTTFTTNVGSSVGFFPLTVAVSSIGKIIVGGYFGIIQLNSDGTVDTSFMSTIGSATNGDVFEIRIAPDDKILIGGGFSTFDGNSAIGLARLNPDGAHDTVFSAAWNPLMPDGIFTSVISLDISSTGDIIACGSFMTESFTNTGVIKVSSSGVEDTTFSTNVGTGVGYIINDIEVKFLPNGKPVIVGNFDNWNGATVGYIVRLNADGTRDTAFSTNTGAGANETVLGIALQADNKIVIVGFFTTWNSNTVNRIVRIGGEIAG
jgi:uncharacterized delta-60 repeat protein